jgi:hypothetical protein
MTRPSVEPGGRQNLARVQISDAESVLECVRLLLTVLLASVCPRHDLVVENLLLRHQLAVLTRPTRTRRRARLLLLGQAALGSGSAVLRWLARAPDVRYT